MMIGNVASNSKWVHCLVMVFMNWSKLTLILRRVGLWCDVRIVS